MILKLNKIMKKLLKKIRDYRDRKFIMRLNRALRNRYCISADLYVDGNIKASGDIKGECSSEFMGC